LNSPLLELYIAYMFGLVLSFYLGFYIVMKYYSGSFRERIRYSITAGLLATKFVIAIASLLGIDHVLFIVRIGVLRIPVTANLILFISNLLAVLSLNWERISKYLTISEEEYIEVFGEY